ncbi:MAG: integrin alpha [Actinomycetota bacterium]
MRGARIYNGDGFADLAIGVPFEDHGTVDEGAVQVIYGGPGGVSASGDQVFHQDTSGMNDTGEEFDNFGFSLASGDFDGDGFDDLAVGVPLEDVGGTSSTPGHPGSELWTWRCRVSHK